MTKFSLIAVSVILTILIANPKTPSFNVSADVSCDPGLCSNGDLGQRLTCIEQVKDKCTSQLQDTQKQEKTLKAQLDIIDGQTAITKIKIEEAKIRIAKLEREIDELSGRIDRLSGSVDQISQILLNRIVQTYKYSNVDTLDLIFSSHGLSDALERLKYIQVAQANDKKMLYQLQATKAAYHDQKQDKETRQAEAEKLNKDLANYQIQLDQQKKDKEELLKVTKNNEANYQSLIRQLDADANAILQAISNVGVSLGEKQRGDPIAHEGNTGCVYPPPPNGYHLHFEVYKDAKVENGKVVDKNSGQPVQFQITDHLVNPRPYLDNGQFTKPINGYPENVSNEFGKVNGYALNGGFHTGIDIADPAGSVIYAADSGTAYAAGGPTCDGPMGYPPGTTLAARGVIMDHHNGFVTLYWHIL